MTIIDPDTERGLYGKYRVERVDGKDKGPYFVLGYTTDPHAAVALVAYAKSCESEYPQLASELREALREQPECECDEPCCQWCEIHGETGNPPVTEHDPYNEDIGHNNYCDGRHSEYPCNTNGLLGNAD